MPRGPEGDGEVEAQLEELQRRYRVMEGSRRSYSEDSQRLIGQQRQVIEKLRQDNDTLKSEVALQSKVRPPARPRNPMGHPPARPPAPRPPPPPPPTARAARTLLGRAGAEAPAARLSRTPPPAPPPAPSPPPYRRPRHSPAVKAHHPQDGGGGVRRGVLRRIAGGRERRREGRRP